MFERFTEASIRAIVSAQEEALMAGMRLVGAEHIVIGLIRDRSTVSGLVFKELGVKIISARKCIDFVSTDHGGKRPPMNLPFSKGAMRAIEAAQSQPSARISTGHLLSGTILAHDEKVFTLFGSLNVDVDKLLARLQAAVNNSVALAYEDLSDETRQIPLQIVKYLGESASELLALAEQEARMMNHSFVGAEHLLLGLLAHDTWPTTRELHRRGITLDRARHQAAAVVGIGNAPSPEKIPVTERTIELLHFAMEERRMTLSRKIEPEHIFQAMGRLSDCAASTILHSLVG